MTESQEEKTIPKPKPKKTKTQLDAEAVKRIKTKIFNRRKEIKKEIAEGLRKKEPEWQKLLILEKEQSDLLRLKAFVVLQRES